MTSGQERFPELAAAFQALEELVRKYGNADENGPEPEVSIYVFGQPPHGVRIGEIGCFWPKGTGGSGASWMRSDAYETGNVLLCAEDFLISYGMEPEWFHDDDEYPSFDYENEARWRLVLALTESTERADESVVKRERPVTS